MLWLTLVLIVWVVVVLAAATIEAFITPVIYDDRHPFAATSFTAVLFDALASIGWLLLVCALVGTPTPEEYILALVTIAFFGTAFLWLGIDMNSDREVERIRRWAEDVRIQYSREIDFRRAAWLDIRD